MTLLAPAKTTRHIGIRAVLSKISRLSASLAFGAAMFGTISVANAELLQISATGLVLRTASASSDLVGIEDKGLLSGTSGRYFAPVPFPNGVTVCAFSLIYHDNDGNDVTARLLKKHFTLGAPTAFNLPVVMAEVSSTGASSNVRRARKLNIKQPLIDATKAFYFVELVVPSVTFIDILGLQIEYNATTCP